MKQNNMMKTVLTGVLCTIFSVIFGQGVVISELYVGGNSGSGLYYSDYVELYNSSESDINVSGWTIQYASETGNFASQTFQLNGIIKSKSFFLIEGTTTHSNGGAVLPVSADNVSTLQFNRNGGKVALVSDNTPLTGTNPTTSNIVDLIGYGSSVNGFEGTKLNTFTNLTSAERKAFSTSTASTMAIGGADEFAGNAYDSNNNSTDFVIRTTPQPQNSSSPTEPVNTNGPNLTFNPSSIPFGNVLTGSSSPEMFYIITGANLTNDVNIAFSGSEYSISKSSGTGFGNSLTFTLAELASPDTVFVVFSPTSDGSKMGTITHTSTGVPGSPTVTLSGNGFTPGNSNFTFDNCTSSLPDGFTQFSVTGAQVWSCTTFGRNPADPTGDLPNGVQMNGFGTTPVQNEDWLISPPISITTDLNLYPLLSFWSRSRFDGDPLQLKISTSYPGSGNPTNSTWTDLDGLFPAVNTNIWTLSEYIDLSAYKGMTLHLAFIYTSTTASASRWTVDDIKIQNSSTPPPPVINTNKGAIPFGFITANTTKVDSINLSALRLTGNVNLSTSGVFTISTDNINFTTALTLLQANANNTTSKIYVKFAPTTTNQSYSGSLSISSMGITTLQISLSGNTVDPASTLEVVAWNIEFFSGAGGPSNDVLQEQNALAVMQNLDADLYGCPEIVDTLAFKNLAESLGDPGEFGYYISTYASGISNTSAPDYGIAQKLGFIYRKSMVSPTSFAPLFYTTNMSDTLYNFWASGRFPLKMEAMVTINSITYPVSVILIHAKAQNSADAYGRRKKAAIALKQYLDSVKVNQRFIIMGDYNDDLDQTVASSGDVDPSDFPNSSYKVIVDDVSQYKALTLPLSLNGEKSTVSFNDVIDHFVVSNEMNSDYVAGSAQIINSVESLIANYGSTTSDHYPVLTRFAFSNPPLPVEIIDLGVRKENGSANVSWSTKHEVNAHHFEVLKSYDGGNWVNLGQVSSTGNASSQINRYAFTDKSTLKEIQYYRLNQVDNDGSSKLTDIVSLEDLTSSTFVEVFPNPVNGLLTIQSKADALINLNIYNSTGAIIASYPKLGKNTVEVDLSDKPAGMYFIEVSSTAILEVKKVLKL